MTHEEYKASVDDYTDVLFRIALNACGNKEDAEDVLQNTFLKLLQYKKQFDSEEHKKRWLIRVVINECHSMFRSPWKKKRQSLETIQWMIAEQQEELSDLFYMVMELPEKYRVVVDLYYYEDYSVKEISDILQIKESTTQTRLMRARQRLKNMLTGECENDR